MADIPSQPYPRPGTTIQFSILHDLGTRVVSDTEFRFAAIQIDGGREATASFAEEEFSRLRGNRGAIRARVGMPVFAQGPTGYNNREAITWADAQFHQAAERRLADYDRQMLDYTQGRTTTRPTYPDLDKIPHWKDDFKTHELPLRRPEPGSVLHLTHLQPPLVPRQQRDAKAGRFAALSGLFGRIPAIGTALAASMAAVAGANAKEIAEAAGRATPLVGAGMAAAQGEFAEAGARLVGDVTFGIGEQLLKEKFPNAGFEPGILTQQERLREQQKNDPVAVANPGIGVSSVHLKQAEKFKKAGHGWRAPEGELSKPSPAPKV